MDSSSEILLESGDNTQSKTKLIILSFFWPPSYINWETIVKYFEKKPLKMENVEKMGMWLSFWYPE